MRLISLLSVPVALLVAIPAQAREHAAPTIDQVGQALSDPQVRAGVATMQYELGATAERLRKLFAATSEALAAAD